jgi:hypothetical protein
LRSINHGPPSAGCVAVTPHPGAAVPQAFPSATPQSFRIHHPSLRVYSRASSALHEELPMSSAPLSADRDAAASLLALVVSANGRIDPRELAELDRLDACERLGITPDEFRDRARTALEETGMHLSQHHWLRLSDQSRLRGLQQAVADRSLQLLVCRLSAAAITADGRVTDDERLIYTSLLQRWSVTPTMVADAIRHDRRH